MQIDASLLNMKDFIDTLKVGFYANVCNFAYKNVCLNAFIPYNWGGIFGNFCVAVLQEAQFGPEKQLFFLMVLVKKKSDSY